MKIYTFNEIVKWARENSVFYRSFYKNVIPTPTIEELPPMDSKAFWAANTVEDNQILTSKHMDGIVFKSGGTSGNPKYSYFTNEEWKSFTQAFGEGMARDGLKDGERIANLFYAGDLYASFLFIMESIEASSRRILHFPLSGAAEVSHILQTMDEFKIDVWAGVPTTIMKIATLAHKQLIFPPKKILFGGESFYPDQREHLINLFPGVIIQSIGYASVDGGLLGYVDSGCKPQEHRVFSEHTILEIVDEETGLPIYEAGKPGKLLLTNLTRKLMPIIRYPVGDRAEWVENDKLSKNRKFIILGRAEEGARIGPATVYYDDVALFLKSYQEILHSVGFQLHIRHFQERDQLLIRIATDLKDESLRKEIESAFEIERSFLKELSTQGKIHSTQVEFIASDKLIYQPRTGKLRRIIDERF